MGIHISLVILVGDTQNTGISYHCDTGSQESWLRLNYAFHSNGQSDSSLKRIIPEPRVPSRGSQARGTRLLRASLAARRVVERARVRGCVVPSQKR